MDTIRNESMSKLALDTIDLGILRWRGISLRKGGPLPKRTNLTLPDEPLPLSDDVLKSLREATRAMGKRSMARLVSDLLERIVSDDLYKAVLDEEMA